MKQINLLIFILFTTILTAQENTYISGSFESNSQILQDDGGLNFNAPSDNFRSNNYFQLDFQNGKILYGVQFESYLPSALLGYSDVFSENSEIVQYYLKYQNEKNEITIGSFYEQFGNGLIFRAWEDRQLGINNSIMGVNYKYYPSDNLEFSIIHGKQRVGFDYSNSVISALNSDYKLSKLLKSEKLDISVGLGFVNRYQNLDAGFNEPKNVNVLGGRFNMFYEKFYFNLEVAKKNSDVLANENIILSQRKYDGTAMQLDVGYSRKGLGLNTSLRRLENFNFYSDKLAEGNIYNQQTISFTPALTKQQDYLLTNIYVYNAQPRLVVNNLEKRAGEIGVQNDIFYTFDKESLLGKFKTKLALNFSYWGSLDSTFNEDQSYETSFTGSNNKYYRDFNLEIKNRWNRKTSSTITLLDLSIDKGVSQGGPVGVQGFINAKVGVVEINRIDQKNRNNRFVVQHLWTKEDRKDWLGFVYELGISNNINLFLSDIWNYGNDNDIHYYNLGGSFSKGASRVGFNYGRQRGGLICVGGVCRFVPESNGFNLNLSHSF
tara:strand:+ start:8046 stop:9689 length:1644 start_codon:yes stop_codon:yes gene_type:complete